jgi:acetyl esterase/lipase
MSGVYDLSRMARLTWMRQTMLEPAFGTDPDGWAAASPIAHVHAGAPPFWVNNAEMDWGLPRDADRFVDRLQDDGVEVTRTTTPNANHITVITRVGQPGDVTTQRLLEFVHRVTAVREVVR